MFINNHKIIRDKPESKKLQITIGHGINGKEIRFQRDPEDENEEILMAKDSNKFMSEDVEIHSVQHSESTPTEEEKTSVNYDYSQKSKYQVKIGETFTDFFPEIQDNYLRDQRELRSRIVMLKALNEKYHSSRYIPLTHHEVEDIQVIMEELLMLREISQNFATERKDALENIDRMYDKEGVFVGLVKDPETGQIEK